MIEYLESGTVKTMLYVVAICILIYFVYSTFFEGSDSDSEEEFANNSSIRDDAAGDKPFSRLSLKEQIQYLEDKQDEIISNSRHE